MELFKKKIKFISAVCPVCGKGLRLDPKLETAFCQYCGNQCIIENASIRNKKASKLEIVLDYLEKKDNQKRNDEKEKEEKRNKNNENRKQWWTKNWWIIPVSFISLMIISLLMKLIEKM